MADSPVEFKYPRWFIFGESSDGFVDVSDGERDVFTHIRREDALVLIRERDALIDVMGGMARAFEEADAEAFVKFWYGT